MDEIDKKIIKILQGDGRIQYNEIAKKLNLANATVHARIIKLMRKGIIDKFVTHINPKVVGKNITVFLSISVDHHKDVVGETLKKLKEMKDVTNVYCVSGDWDYHLLIYTEDIDSMKKLITEDIKKYVPNIIRSSAQIVLDSFEKPMEL